MVSPACSCMVRARSMPPLSKRNFLPKEAVLRLACGKHMLIPISADKRDKLAGNGDRAGNLRNALAYGVRDRSAKQLGGSATSDCQVGTVLNTAGASPRGCLLWVNAFDTSEKPRNRSKS